MTTDIELKKFFENEIKNDNDLLKKMKKESKELYKSLKQVLKDDCFNAGLNSKIIVHSIHYADILRHNSHDNYVKLMNYAVTSIDDLNDFNKLIYLKYKEYCNKYDNISKVMANKIISRDKKVDLIDVEDYVEKSINGLNTKHEDLTNHVFQIVNVKKNVKSRRIF